MTRPEDIYSDRLLALAAEMPRTERLATPQATARAHSKLCGSTVEIDLVMVGDVVTDTIDEPVDIVVTSSAGQPCVMPRRKASAKYSPRTKPSTSMSGAFAAITSVAVASGAFESTQSASRWSSPRRACVNTPACALPP